eukprot:CAMPEP_0119063766 /NCGR_PEP_ID=MMETSP1178-20130426/7022_1 /TAXON_ID=33656 /ORGANISM="unid sp, Strain CCMP2000" /LENGTH=67 /DNA_ID=CAMNT_0007045149 /DNA_START=81 /DNA_END=282 /DNA_ORIENTATION=+
MTRIAVVASVLDRIARSVGNKHISSPVLTSMGAGSRASSVRLLASSTSSQLFSAAISLAASSSTPSS